MGVLLAKQSSCFVQASAGAAYRLHGTLDCTSAGAACIGMRRFRQLWSLHTAASVIGIFHDHKSFPEFLVPSYVKAETAVHWNLSYDRKQGCHPCLRLLIRYSTNSKKGDFDMCSWNGCGNNCGGFGNNCGGWGWNNWGCGGSCGWNRNNRKHSVTDSVKAMMPVSVMDSGRTDDDRRPGGPGARGGREMAAIPDADAAELWEISIPLMCVVNS